MGEKALSCLLHSSWGRGHVKFIFYTDLAGGELTLEIIPISIDRPESQLHLEVLNIVSMYWVV